MKKLRFKNRNGILYYGFNDKFKSSGLKDSKVNRNIITNKFRSGALDGSLNIQDRTAPLVNYYLEQIIQEKRKNVRQSTFKAYKSSFERIEQHFKDKFISEIKPIDIKMFLDSIAHSQNAKTLVNRIRFILKEVFNLSILNEDITINPVSVIKVAKSHHKPKEQKPFNLDEVDLLLEASKGQYKNFLGIAFFTGMRSGEILALKWTDIDFNTDTISVERTLSKGHIQEPKTRSSFRDIEMLPVAREFFENQRYETGLKNSYIFLKQNGRHYANNSLFYNTYRETLDKVGIEKRSLHNTRHTFASMMLNNGIEPLWVSNTLGHRDLSITLQVYAKYVPKKEKMVIGFLEKRYKNGTNEI